MCSPSAQISRFGIGGGMERNGAVGNLLVGLASLRLLRVAGERIAWTFFTSEPTARPGTKPGTVPSGAAGRAGEEFASLASRVSVGVPTVSTFSPREPTLPDST
jgi:hypothetical protein